MLYSIKGKITEVQSNFIVIEGLTGLEYKVLIPQKDFEYYQNLNKESIFKIYTILNLKETSVEIIGFSNILDKEIFLILNNVTGVGVKVALSILSELTIEEIVFAIKNKKEKVFTRVKGIGNKAANRIVLEAKISNDIIEKINVDNLNVKEKLDFSNENVQNAIEALANLGFKKTLVKECLTKEDLNLSTEEIIKICLKKLNKGK